MLEIDGSQGEGGGQILRTSLALSLVTGTPFRIVRIRAGRRKPGLGRQHLAAVRAAASVGSAQVEGDSIGSLDLVFRPRSVRDGKFRFAVGTAGSATLVLQTVLPALVRAGARSDLRLEGGTHNPFAPPFEFLDRCYLPLLRRMGPRVEARLERHGFHPAGGGAFEASIEPVARLEPLELIDRGAVRARRAVAIVSRLPATIADREIAAARGRLGWPSDAFERRIVDSPGPGNVFLIEIESEHVTEVIASFGARGVAAETVASRAADEAARYLESGVPVGSHLADQLMLPLALAGEGRFATLAPSEHARTNASVIRKFLPVDLTPRPLDAGAWEIAPKPCA